MTSLQFEKDKKKKVHNWWWWWITLFTPRYLRLWTFLTEIRRNINSVNHRRQYFIVSFPMLSLQSPCNHGSVLQTQPWFTFHSVGTPFIHWLVHTLWPAAFNTFHSFSSINWLPYSMKCQVEKHIVFQFHVYSFSSLFRYLSFILFFENNSHTFFLMILYFPVIPFHFCHLPFWLLVICQWISSCWCMCSSDVINKI